MIVSPLQSIWRFCEHRGEDDPTDAWQGIDDRHVTMLLLLSRHILPVLPSNGLGKLFAKPVELQFSIGQLALDETQLLDGHSDVSGRSLYCPLSYAQGRFAQLAQHMGRIEATNAMALEKASNGRLSHAGGFLRRWCRFPQIEEPIVGQVVGEFPTSGDSSARVDLATGLLAGRALP